MKVRLKRPDKTIRIITAALFVAGSFAALTHREHRQVSITMGTVGSYNDISAHYAALAEQKAAAEKQRALQEAEAVRLAQAAKARASRGAHRSAIQPSNVGDDVWTALSRCEAGGRATAVSRSGKYFGAFQFSLGTWHGIGMSGNPIDYPYEVQLEAAKRLQARSGWGQWPVCSRKLGLR